MNHVWVRHSILPITVTGATLNPQEGEVWFEYTYNEEALIASIEEAAYGCDLCGIPLIPDWFSTDCKGVPNDLESISNSTTNDDNTSHTSSSRSSTSTCPHGYGSECYDCQPWDDEG